MYMRNTLLLVLTLFVFMTVLPDIADAKHSGWGGSSYRSKINKLDDDPVKTLPVPILLGISLKSITPNFGDPRGGGTRSHEGLDIMAPQGALIVSPTEAVVIRTGNGPDSGKYVTTSNPGNETFVYMHLDEILVKNGEVLKEGALIGYVGNTGNASGGAPHLHWEIRDGRKPTDPYLRVKKEFTLVEKIKILHEIVKNIDADDEDDLLAILVNEYSDVFKEAHAEGIELSLVIEKALASGGGVPTRTLEVGSTGKDVSVLQSVLMREKFLKIDAPTGYFGAQTKSALTAYQKAHKISPSNGRYGSATEKYMKKQGAVGNPVLPKMSDVEMAAKIAELTKQLEDASQNKGTSTPPL